MRNEITVVICNSYVLFREGIKAILQKQATIRVVGEATTGRQALEEVKSLKPNVVLMDLALPDLSSVEVTRRIKEMSADTKVLLLTMYEDETLIKRCLNAGASDYVEQKAHSSQLAEAIYTVDRGGRQHAAA